MKYFDVDDIEYKEFRELIKKIQNDRIIHAEKRARELARIKPLRTNKELRENQDSEKKKPANKT
jgi:hypothetical protein